jgi:hypothetical protein
MYNMHMNDLYLGLKCGRKEGKWRGTKQKEIKKYGNKRSAMDMNRVLFFSTVLFERIFTQKKYLASHS